MIFTNILICNLSAGFMILLTLLIRRIAKYRIPNSVFCLLWMMIGIRLLFPLQIRTPLSILNVYFHFKNKPALLNLESIQEAELYSAPILEQIEVVGETARDYKVFVLLIWLIGCSIAVVRFMSVYFGDRKYIDDSKPLDGMEWLEECVAKQKLRRKISFRTKEGLDSPMTWGIINPTIFFPANFDFADRRFAEAILMHECGHIKYFHFVFKLWNMALTALYWYNPMVWIMYLKFERDLEISADRYSLRATENITRDTYANILIAVAERNQNKKATVSYFYKEKEIEERVKAIMKYKKMGIGAIVATLLIPMGMTTALASTNVILETEETGFEVDYKVFESGMNDAFDVEEVQNVSITVDWDELKEYISNDKTKASSYLIVENYKYVTYGQKLPTAIGVSTTVDGHKYSGTLTLTDYVYNVSSDKYTGYYSGKIYRQD